MTPACPHHLRQWVGAGPGVSDRLPCADPDCQEGTPMVMLYVPLWEPGAARIAGTTSDVRIVGTVQRRRVFRARIFENIDHQPSRWRWVFG